MLKKVIELLLLLGIWIALVWSVQVADLIAGLLVSLLIVLIFSDIFPAEVFRMFHPVRIFWFILYIPVFFWAFPIQ